MSTSVEVITGENDIGEKSVNNCKSDRKDASEVDSPRSIDDNRDGGGSVVTASKQEEPVGDKADLDCPEGEEGSHGINEACVPRFEEFEEERDLNQDYEMDELTSTLRSEAREVNEDKNSDTGIKKKEAREECSEVSSTNNESFKRKFENEWCLSKGSGIDMQLDQDAGDTITRDKGETGDLSSSCNDGKTRLSEMSEPDESKTTKGIEEETQILGDGVIETSNDHQLKPTGNGESDEEEAIKSKRESEAAEVVMGDWCLDMSMPSLEDVGDKELGEGLSEEVACISLPVGDGTQGHPGEAAHRETKISQCSEMSSSKVEEEGNLSSGRHEEKGQKGNDDDDGSQLLVKETNPSVELNQLTGEVSDTLNGGDHSHAAAEGNDCSAGEVRSDGVGKEFSQSMWSPPSQGENDAVLRREEEGDREDREVSKGNRPGRTDDSTNNIYEKEPHLLGGDDSQTLPVGCQAGDRELGKDEQILEVRERADEKGQVSVAVEDWVAVEECSSLGVGDDQMSVEESHTEFDPLAEDDTHDTCLDETQHDDNVEQSTESDHLPEEVKVMESDVANDLSEESDRTSVEESHTESDPLAEDDTQNTHLDVTQHGDNVEQSAENDHLPEEAKVMLCEATNDLSEESDRTSIEESHTESDLFAEDNTRDTGLEDITQCFYDVEQSAESDHPPEEAKLMESEAADNLSDDSSASRSSINSEEGKRTGNSDTHSIKDMKIDKNLEPKSLDPDSKIDNLVNAMLDVKDEKGLQGCVLVRSVRKALTAEEKVFVKMGQIKPCTVLVEKMKPDMVKACILGKMKTSGSQPRMLITSALRLKIARDLNRGMTHVQAALMHGVSKSTVGRIKTAMVKQNAKKLNMSKKISVQFPSNSKRALTFSTRVKIMGKLERGVSVEALSNEYGINKSTLKTLRRLKNERMRERQNSSESSGSLQEMPDSPLKDMNFTPASPEKKKLNRTFRRPKCYLSILMILILQNTKNKTLTYSDIKRLLCYLFPFYSKEWKHHRRWRKIMATATNNSAKNYFLKSRAKGKGDRYFLTLNPVEEENWKKYIRTGTQVLRNEAECVMRRPELLESLLLGIVPLDTWNIAEEEIKNDLGHEENNAHPAGDPSETMVSSSTSNSQVSQKSLVGQLCNSSTTTEKSATVSKRESSESSGGQKRKCDSPSEQSRKFPKLGKSQGSADVRDKRESAAIVAKTGAGHGICDRNVNNRLVNLLMGKEKQQSEKLQSEVRGKSSPLLEGESSCGGRVPKKEHGSSSLVMVDSVLARSALGQVGGKNLAAKSQSHSNFSSSKSQSHSNFSSSSSQSCQNRVPSPSSTIDGVAGIKVEMPESRMLSLQNEEEGNLPKIVSVEDRAYHMWSPQKDEEEEDGDSSPNDNVPGQESESSPGKRKKQNSKTYGKSLLSLVRKGESRSQARSCVPPPNTTVDDGTMRFANPHLPSYTFAGTSHSQSSQERASCSQPSQGLVVGGVSRTHPSQTTAAVYPPPPHFSQPGPPHLSHPQNTLGMLQYPPHHNSGLPDRGVNPSHHNVLAAPMGPPPSYHAAVGGHLSRSLRPPFMSQGAAAVSRENKSGRPIVNMDVQRPLSSWTPTPAGLNSTQRSRPSKEGGGGERSVPKVSDCIETWQKVFPWMYYVEAERKFICSICEWALSDTKEVEVFRLHAPKDVYLVAGQLRYHKETTGHRTIAFKKEKISELVSYVYPILKGHLQEISGVEDIIKTVSNLAGGTFPGPQESPQKEYFMTYMIKHIAECVEVKLFESLDESPFFSVVTVKDKDYAIIRWLNSRGESEEHFFCSQIGYPGEAMSCLTYLKRKNVNMNKLISYSILSNLIGTNIENAVMLQVPVRYPPLSVCLEWLDKASFLKNLFQQLSVLTKLCKSSYHKFAAFPEASEFLNMEEPYSHNCIINEKIINFFFGNIKVLRKIAQDIYKTTGNMEAFGFSALELQECDSLIRCSALFPKLHAIMSSKHSDSQSLCSLLKDFRSKICQRLSDIKHKNSNEYIVMSLVDIFLSHVMLTLLSPGKEVTDIFSKKLRHLSADDLEKIFPNLMSEYQGSSSNCLEKLHSLRIQLGKSRDSSLLQLLAILVSRQELSRQYPELYRLYQKITVLPFLHAHAEQCMFNVAAAEVFLTSKVEKRLMLPVTLILLEGPAVEQLDKTHLMDSWSRKWKISNLHRHMKTQ